MTEPRPGSPCPCCGRPLEEPFSLYVVLDHDHSTGKARAYICQSCNHLLGRFERGATILSRRAIEYLSQYVQKHSGWADYAI